MIDGNFFFDQPLNSMIKTYENNRKMTIQLAVCYTIPISKNIIK